MAILREPVRQQHDRCGRCLPLNPLALIRLPDVRTPHVQRYKTSAATFMPTLTSCSFRGGTQRGEDVAAWRLARRPAK